MTSRFLFVCADGVLSFCLSISRFSFYSAFFSFSLPLSPWMSRGRHQGVSQTHEHPAIHCSVAEWSLAGNRHCLETQEAGVCLCNEKKRKLFRCRSCNMMEADLELIFLLYATFPRRKLIGLRISLAMTRQLLWGDQWAVKKDCEQTLQ